MNPVSYIVKKYNLKIGHETSKRAVTIPNVDRNDLAKLFAELGYKVGAEIGVQRGVYSEILCKANPNLKLFCVDPYLAYKGYDTKQIKYDAFYKQARKRLKPFDCVFVKQFSMDAIKDFDDNSLDFVYIDGNHTLKYVVSDIVEWTRKVRHGGIVSGHDYIRRAHFPRKVNSFTGKFRRSNATHHVPEAVNAYMASYYINPWFIFGRRARIPGEIRDSDRSWMFVKESFYYE